jgi:hypothetical protein
LGSQTTHVIEGAVVTLLEVDEAPPKLVPVG